MNKYEKKLIKKGWKFENDEWISPNTSCEYSLIEAYMIEFDKQIEVINPLSYWIFGY